MQIKKDKLISFLKEIDNELGSEIKLFRFAKFDKLSEA